VEVEAVDEVMVPAAEQYEVVELRQPHVAPVVDVVGVAP
jgi:hypothetical protein